MPIDPTTFWTSSLQTADAGRLSAELSDLKNSKQSDAHKAATDFEAILLSKVLDEMRKTIPQSGLLDSSVSRQMEDMFWQFLADGVGRNGGLGLWRELSKNHESLRTSEAAKGVTPSRQEG